MIHEKIGQTAPPPSITAEEYLIGVIPDAYKGKTFGGKDSFNLIVTSRRLILVYLQPVKDDKPVVVRSAQKYAGDTTAEIIADNKKNIVLEKDQLHSVKYTPGHSYVDCCRKVQEIDGELEIVAVKTKYSCTVPFRRTTIARDVLSKAGIGSLEIIRKEKESETAHSSTGSCCSH